MYAYGKKRTRPSNIKPSIIPIVSLVLLMKMAGRIFVQENKR